MRFLTGLLPTPAVAGVDHRVITLPGGPLHLYRPEQGGNGAALLWLHGGGYLIGSPKQDHALCTRICRELGLVVAAASYRLAPEHPFPAALDDAQAAWQWLQEQALALGVDPRRVVIGGQSAGGGLAASLVHRLRDLNVDPQPKGQWLFYPMLDDCTATRRELDLPRHPLWSNQNNVVGWRSYLEREPGDAQAPIAAVPARRADLSGLPPTWIGIGNVDLFHEECVRHARRLEQAGVPVTLLEVAGAPHGFDGLASKTAIARRFTEASLSWLSQA